MKHPLLVLSVAGLISVASAQILNEMAIDSRSSSGVPTTTPAKIETPSTATDQPRSNLPFTLGLAGATSLLFLIATRKLSSQS